MDLPPVCRRGPNNHPGGMTAPRGWDFGALRPWERPGVRGPAFITQVFWGWWLQQLRRVWAVWVSKHRKNYELPG